MAIASLVLQKFSNKILVRRIKFGTQSTVITDVASFCEGTLHLASGQWFEVRVFQIVIDEIQALWEVRSVNSYRRFERVYCLYLQCH